MCVHIFFMDVDSRARMADMRAAAADKIPAIMLYYYAAAFPSVAQLFLMLVLALSEPPPGFINDVVAMHAYNGAFA